MSASVVGLIYRIKFGSMAAKSIAAKLADNSNDDGENIFPAKKTVAAAVECSKRTVDRYMDLFLVLDLLHLVRLGGGRRTDTMRRGRLLRSGRASVYAWNMPLLERLANGEITVAELMASAKLAGRLTEDGDANPDVVAIIKGAADAPFEADEAGDTSEGQRVSQVHPFEPAKGCNPDTQRVQPWHTKGAGAAPEPSLNHHLTPTLSAGEGEVDLLVDDEQMKPAHPAARIEGWAKGWTVPSRARVLGLFDSPIAAHVATDFLAHVVGTLNPPMHTDPVPYVRQLGNRLQAFPADVLSRLAARLIETQHRDLPSTAKLVDQARELQKLIEAEATRARTVGAFPNRPRYVVRDGDLQWQPWIEHLRFTGQTETVAKAYAARAITVTHKFPQPSAQLVAIGEGQP